jgi:hypothetical protein
MKLVAAWVVAVMLSGLLAAQPAAPGKGKDSVKEEAPQIEGMEVSRGDRGFIGVQIVDAKFRLNFYDQDKEPVAPDVSRATLRWDPRYKIGQEQVVLIPGGGPNVLTSERVIRPPYLFKLFIVLVKDAADGEEPILETHVIDFRQ